ncbi:MAG: hypothetical protein LCH69_13385 [Proteobacteria bacterium]|nr:hypothetical protein [Pseudomonadota bacterium]
MPADLGSNDFIGRIRQRHQPGPAPAPLPMRTFIVQITRDGKTTEELTFDRAPSIGAIAARVGTEAYVISIEMLDTGTAGQLAAQ